MEFGYVRGRDVLDVGLAAVNGRDLPGVEVDADNSEAGARHFDGERQADIAEPDHAHTGGSRRDLLVQRFGSGREWGSRRWRHDGDAAGQESAKKPSCRGRSSL